MRDRQRIQPRAGRLDLLLQDPETNRRYEVELQLGSTDEAHIVRTIEYWDIERKRYPQYDHCAVLIAEDITSRFLNVISLFNASLPLIAIQMQAIKVAEHTSLVFTTVMDVLTRGPIDEDEDAQAAPTDRVDWEKKSTNEIMSMVDHILNIIHKLDPNIRLNYTKMYVGLAQNGRPNNFMLFQPRKNRLVIRIKLTKADDIKAKMDAAGIDYDERRVGYRLRLTKQEQERHSDLIHELIRLAYDNRSET